MKKNRLKKIVAIIIVVVIILGIVGGLLIQSLLPADVETVKLASNNIEMKLSTNGIIRSANSNVAYLPNGISVKEYFVKQGQIVKKGDPLAVLSNNNTLICEFEVGVVSVLNKNIPATLQSSQPLLIVDDMNNLVLDVSVNKYDISSIKLGQKTNIYFANKTYTGTVEYISNAVDSSNSGQSGSLPTVTTKIKIDNPDQNLILGFSADIDIVTENRSNVQSFPIEIVKRDAKGDYCFIVDENKAKKVYLKTGIYSSEYIEIVSGIDKDQLAIKNVTKDILDGSKVKPSNK